MILLQARRRERQQVERRCPGARISPSTVLYMFAQSDLCPALGAVGGIGSKLVFGLKEFVAKRRGRQGRVTIARQPLEESVELIG